MSDQSPPCLLRYLGVQPYVPVLDAMHAFVAARTDDTPDELWLLQHEAVFTQGQAGRPEHILDAHGIPVVQSDRGGQVTYHGPGQLIIYFLIDIKRRQYGVRRLVDIIETAILTLLAEHGIKGELRAGAPGVYVNGKKIAALGLRIRRGSSLHGLSLNVDMDLMPFTCINPCGYAGLEVCSLADQLGADIPDLFARTETRLAEILLAALHHP